MVRSDGSVTMTAGFAPAPPLHRRSALTLPPGVANVELAVFVELSAADVRAAFLPPEVTAEPQELSALDDLTYEADGDDHLDVPLVRLTRATLLQDGRIKVTTEPDPEAGWVLADHDRDEVLHGGTTGVATTAGTLDGPLVRVVDAGGVVLSSWALIDDPVALNRALMTGESTGSGRPSELSAGDLDTPLGRILQHIHETFVMDASEIAAPAGSTSGVDGHEAAEGPGDDNLWARLEQETLGRDPRAGAYARVGARDPVAGLADPLVELLDMMRDQAPAPLDAGQQPQSLLGRLARRGADDHGGGGRRGSTWSTTARIRVWARNVLRCWAAAQTDPRLTWVNPLAPLGNLDAIASIFVELYLRAIEAGDEAEPGLVDLDDLWARWSQPFVGSGHGDGWLERADIGSPRLKEIVGPDFVDVVSALCWLAIRPGADRRERIVSWQPARRASLEKGLIEVNKSVAEYLSIIVGQNLSEDQVAEDLLAACDFIDDRLWCKQTAHDLGLTHLSLEAPNSGQSVALKVIVGGIDDPLYDPRLATLVTAARAYRSVEAVVVFAHDRDHDWRLIIEPGAPAVYMAAVNGTEHESHPLVDNALDAIAAGQGVLADLFPRLKEIA